MRSSAGALPLCPTVTPCRLDPSCGQFCSKFSTSRQTSLNESLHIHITTHIHVIHIPKLVPPYIIRSARRSCQRGQVISRPVRKLRDFFGCGVRGFERTVLVGMPSIALPTGPLAYGEQSALVEPASRACWQRRPSYRSMTPPGALCAPRAHNAGGLWAACRCGPATHTITTNSSAA